MGTNTVGTFDDHTVYQTLIQLARSTADPAQRWRWLEAAHIVGQRQLWPHLQTHGLMLSLALHLGDWKEVAGQLLRLVLVPLGHITGRLPLGNPGRATVNAFQAMTVRPDLHDAIAQARELQTPRKPP